MQHKFHKFNQKVKSKVWLIMFDDKQVEQFSSLHDPHDYRHLS